jgi:hypothetical protein
MRLSLERALEAAGRDLVSPPMSFVPERSDT